MGQAIAGSGRVIFGLLIALGLTWIAYPLASMIPYVSPLLVALFGGMMIGSVAVLRSQLEPGARFAGKRLLRLAVAVLGLRLSFSDFAALGWETALVIAGTIGATLVFGWFLSSRLGLSRQFGALISAGTAICGASAVATVAPIANAKESEVTFSITLVTLFGLLGVLVYPPFGQALGMSDWAFGVWAGTAIHDTAQVMAAAFTFSPEAGEVAAAAKMLRITGLLPVTMLYMLIFSSRKPGEGSYGVVATVRRTVPGFLVAFALLVLARSLGWVPDRLATLGAKASEVLLVTAMAGVGMTTRLRSLQALGWRSVAVGFASAIVAGLVGYLGVVVFGIG